MCRGGWAGTQGLAAGGGGGGRERGPRGGGGGGAAGRGSPRVPARCPVSLPRSRLSLSLLSLRAPSGRSAGRRRAAMAPPWHGPPQGGRERPRERAKRSLGQPGRHGGGWSGRHRRAGTRVRARAVERAVARSGPGPGQQGTRGWAGTCWQDSSDRVCVWWLGLGAGLRLWRAG